jgi:hypothetical protein
MVGNTQVLADTALSRMEKVGRHRRQHSVRIQRVNNRLYKKNQSRFKRRLYQHQRNNMNKVLIKGEQDGIRMLYENNTKLKMRSKNPKYVESYQNGVIKSIYNWIY